MRCLGLWITSVALFLGFAGTANGLSTDQINQYLGHIEKTHIFDTYAGKNGELQENAQTDTKEERVAAGIHIDMTDTPLFGTGFREGTVQVYVSAIQSIDAFSVRLVTDLSHLPDSQELWIIDPTIKKAYGPYTNAEENASMRWLPTINGDTAVLVARDGANAAPTVEVIGLAHYFIGVQQEKELSCHIDIACETNTLVKKLASAVGYLRRTTSDLGIVVGSGVLINIPQTTALEPYFLTANHVVATDEEARSVEVVWDYRPSTCGENDVPTWNMLPRSEGIALLSTSSDLDMTLIKLDKVPVGTYGRTYLGWDTRAPTVGDKVVSIHHPGGTHMRVSHGTVEALDQAVSSKDLEGKTHQYIHETRIQWNPDGGMTEGGSSGGCLLYLDSKCRILGALSSGPQPSCDAEEAFDFYGTFYRFAQLVQNAAFFQGSSADYAAYGENTDTDDGGNTSSGGCAGGTINGLGTPPNGDGMLFAITLFLLLTGTALYSRHIHAPVHIQQRP